MRKLNDPNCTMHLDSMFQLCFILVLYLLPFHTDWFFCYLCIIVSYWHQLKGTMKVKLKELDW